MKNSNKDDFAIKSLQSLLRELSLYGGQIDGLFGKGCRDGFITMLKTKDPSFNKELTQGSYEASQVFTFIQTGLAAVGLYTGRIDGLTGPGTMGGFENLCQLYRVAKGIPEYWFAWTNHKNVPLAGVQKLEAWIVKMGKPTYHTSYMLSCFALETSGKDGPTFNPGIVNPKSGATGLIQFMPKGSALDLGTTCPALAKMSFVDQLDYVFKYFEKYNYINKCKSLEDYYLSIFYPRLVGHDLNEVIARAGSLTYSQNIGFDPAPHKGYYTVGDVGNAITTFYWNGMNPKNRLIKP